MASWIQLLTAIAAFGGFFTLQTHYIDKRLEALEKRMDERFRLLEQNLEVRFKALDDRINALEKRLLDRIERLEHPVSRA
jgi:flagellar capping protein FliD